MKPPHQQPGSPFSREIGKKENRKLKAQGKNKRSVWFGLGVFGMIGWSVAVPTLLGTALGAWLDRNHPESFSWTLTLLLAGLITGCLIAWNWVAKENKDMHSNNSEEEKEKNDA